MPETVCGGKVELLPDGETFFRSLFSAIGSAEKLICLEYYRIRSDSTGRSLAGLLSSAVGRGVKVFIIYDAIGCHVTPDEYFHELQTSGVECLPFNPISFRKIHLFDRRDHRKVAIIDGRVAYLGGFNIGDAYSGVADGPDCFRDLGFTLGGSAVGVLMDMFAATWCMETGKKLEIPACCIGGLIPERDTEVTLINGGPHQRRSAIRTAFRVAMASAQRELLIANPYFVPGPGIIRSLLRAARRGVKVRLLLPARSDVPVVRLLSRGTYEPLLKAGIEIHEMDRQLLHAKMMLVDRERTVLGSANLDQRSFHRNFEINAIIRSSEFGGQVRRLFELDFASSRPVSLDEHVRRGFAARLLELLLRPISWFL